MERHPTTAHWSFPRADRPPLPGGARRTNLRELEARPGRFEHHLMVVGRVGNTQLEAVTASEPLFFAHQNISDEYALPLRTGDALADAMPFRTFFADVDTGADLGRVKHAAGQLVLHPHGILHWPGKLRPPYETFAFAPGMRRCGLSLVYCACEAAAPSPDAPVFVSDGNDGACKAYTDRPIRFHLATLAAEPSRTVAAVADSVMRLAVDPATVAAPRGAYAVVLDAAADAPFFATDLVWIPPGAELALAGVRRALVIESPTAEAEPPPPSWDETPAAPFPVYEDAPADALPISERGLELRAADDAASVLVRAGDTESAVPRYWLARFLFRTALHDFRLGYLETYGGFTYDDRGGDVVLGVRGGGSVAIPRADATGVIERLYRAVAPAGYTERLV